jgi:hypothetical protein
MEINELKNIKGDVAKLPSQQNHPRYNYLWRG